MGALSKQEVYRDEFLELLVLRGAIFSLDKQLREEKDLNKAALLSIINFAKDEVNRVRADRVALGFGFGLMEVENAGTD